MTIAWRPFMMPAVVALGAWLSVVATIDPGGDYPWLGEGPGLTLDEPFNVQQGVVLADRLFELDFDGIQKELATNPDHPPLGRLWLGLWHEIAYLIAPPQQPHDLMVVACARVGSAAAFGLLLFAIAWYGQKWWGWRTGLVAALSVWLMPRVFGHAHIASLETCMNLTYALAVLVLADRWTVGVPASAGFVNRETSSGRLKAGLQPRHATLAGIIFGLALLTKIQAVLLPIPIVLWALWTWRQRAIVPLVVWGGTAFVVFFLGWPWLWNDPVGHLREYFARTTDRTVLHVWYFGKAWIDRDVPWHYPWVLFAVTMPMSWLVFGMWGVFASRTASLLSPLGRGAGGEGRPALAVAPQPNPETLAPPLTPTLSPGGRGRHCIDSRNQLLLACILFPLVVFSLPGVAVYDGERLFSVVFPLWGLFVGQGGAACLDWLSRNFADQPLARWFAKITVAVAIAGQGLGIVMEAPCWLSDYNRLVGGLRGADSLGLQATYWGDSFSRSFLRNVADAVPAGSTVNVVPVMHPGQLVWISRQTPVLREKEIRLRPFEDDARHSAKYLMVYLRKDAIHPWQRETPPGASTLVELRRNGVLLAVLFELN
ncbi:MAG: hypothetical protein HZA46_16090 [Planctomycetales bacterium]|nr:hypothetical protein [Planctomycetales bacterium]